jgi:hypothetical protein
MLPTNAGSIKLMNQTVTDVNVIPKLFAEINRINCNVISPLTPTSTNAIVGTIARAKKTMLMIQKAVATGTFTSNKRKTKMYCIIKTQYLMNERSSKRVKSCTLNFWTDLMKYSHEGFFNTCSSHFSIPDKLK